MARNAAVTTTEPSWRNEQDQRMRDVRFSVGENRFVVTFDSGKEYSFPRPALEVDDGSDVVRVQLERRRFFFRVIQSSGNRYEVPWDRVLHEAEPAYRHFRGHMRISRTTVGATIRKLRAAKGSLRSSLRAPSG